MIIIPVNKERGIETALKNFKFKIQRTKLINELRERREFQKPSNTRRNELKKAIYIQKKNDLED